jgi:hypothetical protein
VRIRNGAIMPGYMVPPSDYGYLEMTLIADEGTYPALADINYFLHDFNLLYEITRIKEDPYYRAFPLNRFFFYRNRNRIEPEDQLYVATISQQSPLLTTVITAATLAGAKAFESFVSGIERLYNLPQNHELKKLEVEKMRKELANIPEGRQRPQGVLPHGNRIAKPIAHPKEPVGKEEKEYDVIEISEKIEQRLGKNPVHIRTVTTRYLKRLPPEAEQSTFIERPPRRIILPDDEEF